MIGSMDICLGLTKIGEMKINDDGSIEGFLFEDPLRAIVKVLDGGLVGMVCTVSLHADAVAAMRKLEEQQPMRGRQHDR
jgi:hypothetical protein